jgi:hypothetical protein
MTESPKPPVVVKMYPAPEEYQEAETNFFYALGNCVNRWAFVDRQLYRLCRFGLQLDSRQTSIIYYRDAAFNRRLKLVDTALRSVLTKEQASAEWQPLNQRAFDLSRVRNVFVHHPAKRLGTSDGEKGIYVYSIHIEPYYKLVNQDVPGLNGKTELSISDLEDHVIEVEKLENDLHSLHASLVKVRNNPK